MHARACHLPRLHGLPAAVASPLFFFVMMVSATPVEKAEVEDKDKGKEGVALSPIGHKRLGDIRMLDQGTQGLRL